jgi:hypothetical protein
MQSFNLGCSFQEPNANFLPSTLSWETARSRQVHLAVLIVEFFEVIDIEHEQTELISLLHGLHGHPPAHEIPGIPCPLPYFFGIIGRTISQAHHKAHPRLFPALDQPFSMAP